MTAPRISPSRLPMWRTCKRQYWLKEVARVPAGNENAPHFQFGTEAHEAAQFILEGREAEILVGGWAFEVGVAFAALTREAVTHVHACELEVHVDGPDGGHYDGRIDCVGWRGEELVIVDHKTSRDPVRYAKAEDELAADSQCLLYAFAAMDMFGVESAVCHWHWVTSQRRANALDTAVVTEIRIDIATARAAAEAACRDAVEILSMVDGGLEPLPYYVVENDWTEARCIEGYGCPYVGACEDLTADDESNTDATEAET